MNAGRELLFSIKRACERSHLRALLGTGVTGGCVCMMALMVLLGPSVFAEGGFNCLTNGDFEVESAENTVLPAAWFPFTSKSITVELSPAMVKSGARGLKMTVQGVKNASQGLAQIIPVEGGATYVFSVSVRNSKESPLSKGAFGTLYIEWKNSSGKEISRERSREWDMSLSRMRWESFSVTGKAPRDATQAAFSITFYDGQRGGVGMCFVDEARVEVK